MNSSTLTASVPKRAVLAALRLGELPTERYV